MAVQEAQVCYFCLLTSYILTLFSLSDRIVSRVRWGDGTGNLSKHVKQCEKKDQQVPEGQRINDFAHGSTYTKARFRYIFAKWIARRNRPFTIAQDPELLELFRMLYAKVEVPHPSTISSDVREIFRMARKQLAKVLQVCMSVRGCMPCADLSTGV